MADKLWYRTGAENRNDLNYLCTYDLYGPVLYVFDAGRYITSYVWKWGGGVGAGNLEFCGPL
jgi:hypothetical protein